MTKKSYVKFLGLLLVVGLLFAAAPVGQAQAATLDVCPSGCTYSTIQAAINAANPGDTINVAAGTYTEQLLIQKDLILVGAGIGQTIVQAPTTGRATAPGYTSQVWTADNWNTDYLLAAYPTDPINGTPISVKVSGFTFDANSQGHIVGDRFTGVYFRKVANADITQAGLFASEIKGFLASDPSVTGIRVLESSKLTLDSNLVKDYTILGIVVYGTDNLVDPIVTTSNNTLTPLGVGQGIQYRFINGTGTAGEISNNTITNGGDFGIAVSTSDHVLVKDNTSSAGTGNGITLESASNCVVQGNTIANYPWNGIAVTNPWANSDGNLIQGNTISGIHSGDTSSLGSCGWGIGMDGSSVTNTVVTGNDVSSSDAGIVFYGVDATNVAHNNIIHDNSPYNLGNSNTSVTINAENNWWGSAAGPVASTISGLVDYDPWLTHPPVHNVTQDTYFSTIQAAIAAAVAGDTINVAPGEYVEVGQIVIDKNLTIVGADKATTIIKPAQDTGNGGDARGWFLVNAGVQFNLSNVTLDGAGKLVSIGILSHGTGTIENNIIKNIGYNPSGPDYAGRGIAIYDADMTIKNNLLQNIGRIGIYVYGTNADLVVIDGNTYEGKGAGNWLDYGIEIEGGADAEVKHNLIKNCTGVASVDGSGSAGLLITTYFASGSTANIHDNEFNGNSVGINVGYDSTDTSSVVAEKNQLLNNVTAIVTTAPAVDGSPNWWGSIAGPGASQISGEVDFTPWCANAECTAFLPVDLGMDPSVNTAPICNIGTETIIAVKIGPVVKLSGYTIKVNFDKTKGQILDVYNGDVLPAGGIETAKDLGNTTGQLVLNYATIGAPINDVDGGNLVYIKVKHLALGDIVFTLDAGSQLTGTDDQILFPYTIDPATSTLTVCGLVAENFNWTTGDTAGNGWLSGISAGFHLEEADFTGATSLVVELRAADNSVLQRDTAVISKFASLTVITAPFDMYGNFNYATDGYWINERIGDYGTVTQPACAVATATLANGCVVTAQNCNLTGDESTIQLSLVAEDFAYMAFSNVLGVTAGFHPVNFGMDQAQSLKVELFTGAGTVESPYVLLQTNTSPVPGAHGTASGVPFSGPFDIFGSFNYAADLVPGQTYPFWNNVRAAEYGQTAIPTRVLATVVMPGGLVVTAENTNLTGDRASIILGDLTAGPLVWSNYEVSPELGWLRGVSADFELTNNTFTGASSIVVKLYTAGKAQLLQTATAADLSKFAGMTWITAPFDIFGHFNYALDGYWTVVRETEYGQSPTVVPDCVVATATLFNGKIVTAERCGFTYGSRADILPGTLTAQDFGYMDFSGVLGVSAGFLLGDDVTMADAESLIVRLYSGTTLLQTNTAYVGPTSAWGTAVQISGPFDIFGGITYGTSYWSNLRESPEYGQTMAPTKVVATLTLKNGKVLTAENTMLTGDRDTILPDIIGTVKMQGRLTDFAGVPMTLTAGSVVYNTTSNGLSSLNFIFDAVEGYNYTFTTNQPRYLNITADLAKTILADKSKTLPDLRLRAGNAVWTDNEINLDDANKVGTDWGSVLNTDGDVNFDSIVNIQDLALVGGNFDLTSTVAYGTWLP